MNTVALDEAILTIKGNSSSSTMPPATDQVQHDVEALWAATSVEQRIKILRAARHELASRSASLSEAISADLFRTMADTRAAEILPLLAACHFLEKTLGCALAAKRLGRRGLPFWLAGVDSEVHRVPLGWVLVIAPSNYPLFLPGVQVLQALAAGNAVTWKPGSGGRPVAKVFAEVMSCAGLPEGLLRVTEESIDATYEALDRFPAKVFFTGSAETGRILMRRLAETLTPSVMELSGCDAVIVLPSADVSRVVRALTFGMRLNGSATCMAPRRILLVEAGSDRRKAFLSQLQSALSLVSAVRLSGVVSRNLQDLLEDVERQGAHVLGDATTLKIAPILVTEVRPEMRLAQADIFAPVLSVIDVAGQNDIAAAQEACPFGLTVSIFGDEHHARRIARTITAGSVIINDIIVPSADPRLPFGGRRASGFGVTRGLEGLLEMTAVKTVAVRRGKSERHYEATTTSHASLFDGLITASHSSTWADRWRGVRQMAAAGRLLARNKRIEDQHGEVKQ